MCDGGSAEEIQLAYEGLVIEAAKEAIMPSQYRPHSQPVAVQPLTLSG